MVVVHSEQGCLLASFSLLGHSLCVCVLCVCVCVCVCCARAWMARRHPMDGQPLWWQGVESFFLIDSPSSFSVYLSMYTQTQTHKQTHTHTCIYFRSLPNTPVTATRPIPLIWFARIRRPVPDIGSALRIPVGRRMVAKPMKMRTRTPTVVARLLWCTTARSTTPMNCDVNYKPKVMSLPVRPILK